MPRWLILSPPKSVQNLAVVPRTWSQKACLLFLTLTPICWMSLSNFLNLSICLHFLYYKRCLWVLHMRLMGILIWKAVQKCFYLHLFGTWISAKRKVSSQEIKIKKQRKLEIKLGDELQSLFCFLIQVSLLPQTSVDHHFKTRSLYFPVI